MIINANKAGDVSACSARLTAAMLRRAVAVPILAAPPIRSIQAWPILKVKAAREKIGLNCDAELVYKERNYWLGLKRPSLAGFKAPDDSEIKIYNYID